MTRASTACAAMSTCSAMELAAIGLNDMLGSPGTLTLADVPEAYGTHHAALSASVAISDQSVRLPLEGEDERSLNCNFEIAFEPELNPKKSVPSPRRVWRMTADTPMGEYLE